MAEDTLEGRKGRPDAVIQVTPNIWFGPYDYTFSPECVHKFTHVINCDTEESSTSPAVRSSCKFRHYPSYDHWRYRILDTWLPQAREFVADAPAVYIHCYVGSNRSAALALGLASHHTNESLDHVLARVRSETSRAILDNTGFVRQLVEIYGPRH